MRLARYIFAVVAVGALVACGTAAADPPRQTAPADPTAEVQDYAARKAVWVYTVAVNANQAAAWYAWAWGNDLARLAADYRPPAPPAPPAPPKPPAAPRSVSGPPVAVNPSRPAAPRPASGPPVGGACGGASNGADAYIGRESGGNPNARNPSGAWGCYQIMPGTWASSCSDLGQHGSASTQAQAQCASRLPSSAWAASGG